MVEFLSITRVMEITGLSKSVIYREMRLGRFPTNYPYRDQPRRRFWLSRDVLAWQQAQVDVILWDNEFDELLTA